MSTTAMTATWSTGREIWHVLARPQHLRRAATVSVLVGTVFFVMNQLGALLAGGTTLMWWFKAALTYLTPLVVSSIGVLSATHRPTTTE